MFDFMLTTVADKLATGGLVTLLGMGTVFSVLALLWGLVEVLHILLNRPQKKKTVAVIEESHTSFPAAEATSVPAPPATDDLAIIAVITAAIAAASGSSPSSFRVVSFKRANHKFSGK